jgi:hypothetical protein
MDQGILDRACLSFPTHLTCTRTLTSGPFLSALQAIACTILSTCVFFLGGYLHRREEQKYAKLEAAATNDDLAPAVADADRLTAPWTASTPRSRTRTSSARRTASARPRSCRSQTRPSEVVLSLSPCSLLSAVAGPPSLPSLPPPWSYPLVTVRCGAL